MYILGQNKCLHIINLVSSSYKRLLSTNGWVKYDVTAGNGLHVGTKIFK